MNAGDLGPIYPMEFRYRSCDADASGQNTKTCHCAEGSWINGGVAYNQLSEPWKTFGNEIREAYGQFYRTGTFPENTLKSYKDLSYIAFNVLDGAFNYEEVRPEECAALDAVDNYLWDKWAFDNK